MSKNRAKTGNLRQIRDGLTKDEYNKDGIIYTEKTARNKKASDLGQTFKT